MNTAQKSPADFPTATVARRAAFSVIWAVPVIAALVAGVLVFENLRTFGPMITIQFDNANGLDANQTVLRYRGIRVGSVRSLQLTTNLQHVEVRARLERSAAGLAHDGSIFWIVRPEVGAAGIHALETIVSGPYIEVLPGASEGPVQNRFIGANQAPIIKPSDSGAEFVLRATQVRSLGADSPVYYRGLQAGKVLYLELSPDSTTVNIHVFLKPNFSPLVRSNTVWWNAGGIEINWHLLSGLNMAAENLRSVVTGGVAFATPSEPAGPVPAGTSFVLYSKPEEKWLEWSPHFQITNTAVSVRPSISLENVEQPPKQ